MVLFPDGSFRFDYPGANAAGGSKTFVGFSLGTGPDSADVVMLMDRRSRRSGQLITPKARDMGRADCGRRHRAPCCRKGKSSASASAGLRAADRAGQIQHRVGHLPGARGSRPSA